MILVTGCAGFIGFHVASALLAKGVPVIGVDNVNDYYEPSLKERRLEILNSRRGFTFYKIDICDLPALKEVFANNKIRRVCHLAAQAGVRYSLENPFVYQRSNNEGFLNMLECARHNPVENFVYASTSSVYGSNTKLPFCESDRTDNPMTIYAATKKANEIAAHSYSHLFSIPTSGMRFFTVYGPWGRPDMALFIFTKAILEDKPINVFNQGKMTRNFTYVDDIVKGVLLALDNPRPYEIYNIGNNRTETLMDFIAEIEKNVGKKATINFMPMQPGDVPDTRADIEKLSALGYRPSTNIDVGVKNFVTWYREYYGA
jgi:UDP-glucuronate 4-epimerase